MNQKQLLEVIKAMKHEILDLLINNNMADDEVAQQTLSAINEMFSRLNLEIDDVIPKETLVAYFGGVDEATKLLDNAGVDPKYGLGASINSKGIVRSAFNTRAHLEAIAEITDNTILDLKAAIRTARFNAIGSIETALSSVKSDLQRGIVKGNAREIITQRIAEAFAKDGMTSFITVDGKRLPLDFYSEVVARTNLKKANVDGALNRYLENGVDLVKIFERSDGCAECAKFDGIVVSLTGKHEGYPTVDEAPLPPRHPNCRGSIRPYVIAYKSEKEIEKDKRKWKEFNPDKDIRTRKQKEIYEKQQAFNRQENAEKKQFMEWNATLGAENFKTLGAFRRAKRSNSVRFQELQSEFRSRRLTKSN